MTWILIWNNQFTVCSKRPSKCITSVTCLNCKKRKESLLGDLSNNELNILNSNRYEVSYKSGEIICKEGIKPLGLVCLNKGKVKILRRGVNGIQQIVGLKKAVDFIHANPAIMQGFSFFSITRFDQPCL